MPRWQRSVGAGAGRRQALQEGVSKGALFRRYVAERLRPARVNEVVYGRLGSRK